MYKIGYYETVKRRAYIEHFDINHSNTFLDPSPTVLRLETKISK